MPSSFPRRNSVVFRETGVIAGSTNFYSNKRSLRYQSSKTFSKRSHGVNTRKHYFILSCQASTQRNLLNLDLQFSCQGGGVLVPGFLRKPTFSSAPRPGYLEVPDVKRSCLLSSYPRNFIYLFIHSQVKFLWLFSLTYTLMCSLIWPGHFNFFYSCVGYWRILYWFGDPLSCQASANDQWKVCIYYIFSQSQFCQDGNNSWNRIDLVFQLFECQAQVGHLCRGGGGGEGRRVLWISSDKDAWMGAKIKTKKNS